MTDGTMFLAGGAVAFVLLGILGGIMRRSDAKVAQHRGREAVRKVAAGVRDDTSLSVSELMNRPYTTEDHRRDMAYRKRQERRRALRSVALMVALFAVGVIVFVSYGSIDFLRTYWQPIVLFVVGIYGIVQAKRLVDKFNTWDVPYTLSIVVGVGGLVLGVIRLVQIGTA